MYNLDRVVRLYFSAVSTKSIFDGSIRYDSFPPAEFGQMLRAYAAQYSDTEDRHLYAYIKDSGQQEGHLFAAMEDRSGLNVFAALEELSEQLLTMEGNQVVCQYNNLLRFREVTREVEEDLLVCAYLAMRYKRYRETHEGFSWNMALQHNNMQLRHIMERKISENHFHLYGSAPSYHLIWIEIMNHIGNGSMVYKLSRDFEEKQREIKQHYSVEYSEEKFISRILKAALLRVYLFMCCAGWKIEEEELLWLQEILQKVDEIEFYYDDILQKINEVQGTVILREGKELTDYALCEVGSMDESKTERYYFSGERWLMYQMLKKELTEEGTSVYAQWFYAYLLLKQNIRSELVQVNNTVGFENFSIYSHNKGVYKNYDKMIESAVYGSVGSGNIKSLEMRITPGNCAEENGAIIRDIDNVIQNRENPYLGNNYYFVFHFTKCPDEELSDEECYNDGICRHHRKRRSLENQANEIYLFRERYGVLASRVRGIDACSQEIGCRPEVFAVIFRFLSEHIVQPTLGVKPIGQLQMTYHVGEDFLDVVDGLRAVDEAVHFLNLQCGDRIGHGTVLGIDVKSWYSFKQNTIVLSQQDYLDNIVWLYHKLTEYNIKGNENLCNGILKDFNYYFSKIYGHFPGDDICDIHTYYEAWKLRGDDPELYESGEYRKEETLSMEWRVNRRYPERFDSRSRREVSRLYFRYHYDWKVRKEGSRSIQAYIPPLYVEGVAAVQKAMQKEFAARGIGIETNPSSNLAISTIQGYGEHPIINLYNNGITYDTKKLADCPQINVSVNTDDKGIFHTSLENEYGLLACAMEKLKDENGNPVYNRQLVYQWIDNIREMGNMQSFLN